MARESEVIAAVKKVLELAGIFFTRTNTGMAMLPGRGGRLQPVRFGRRGAPDFTGVLSVRCPGARHSSGENTTTKATIEKSQPGGSCELPCVDGVVGIAFGIECKTTERWSKLTPDQVDWHARFAKAGGAVVVVTSGADAAKWLQSFYLVKALRVG